MAKGAPICLLAQDATQRLIQRRCGLQGFLLGKTFCGGTILSLWKPQGRAHLHYGFCKFFRNPLIKMDEICQSTSPPSSERYNVCRVVSATCLACSAWA
jgi:hypothetical protein